MLCRQIFHEIFAAEHEATILGLGGNASFIYETSGLNGTKTNVSFNSFGFDVVFGLLQDNDWAVIDAISFDLPQKLLFQQMIVR